MTSAGFIIITFSWMKSMRIKRWWINSWMIMMIVFGIKSCIFWKYISYMLTPACSPRILNVYSKQSFILGWIRITASSWRNLRSDFFFFIVSARWKLKTRTAAGLKEIVRQLPWLLLFSLRLALNSYVGKIYHHTLNFMHLKRLS